MTTENAQNQEAPKPTKRQEAQLTADYRQGQFNRLGKQAGPYKSKIKFIGVNDTNTDILLETLYMVITVDELEAIQAILTKKVYKVDELPEDIQQKILENYADINVNFDWWDSMYEDAKNVLLRIDGFDLARNRHCTGNFIEYAEDTAKKIIAEHGESCETWGTATNYLTERAELVKKYSDGVSVYDYDNDQEKIDADYDNDQEKIDAEFLRSILEDYSIMLQKEYEYKTSEEAIIETLKANDYDFTVDGKID